MTECGWMWQTVVWHWEEASRTNSLHCHFWHFLVWRKCSSTSLHTWRQEDLLLVGCCWTTLAVPPFRSNQLGASHFTFEYFTSARQRLTAEASRFSFQDPLLSISSFPANGKITGRAGLVTVKNWGLRRVVHQKEKMRCRVGAKKLQKVFDFETKQSLNHAGVLISCCLFPLFETK